MKMKWIGLFLWFLVAPIFGQFIPQGSFLNYVSDQLPHASIEEMHFDANENLWYLGSNNQIYYFDGLSFNQLPLAFRDTVEIINGFLIDRNQIYVPTIKGIFLVNDIYSMHPEINKVDFLPYGEYTRIIKDEKHGVFLTIHKSDNQIIVFNEDKILTSFSMNTPPRYLHLKDSLLFISTDAKKIDVFRYAVNEIELLNEISLSILEKNYYIEPLILVNNSLYALVNEFGILKIDNYQSPSFTYTLFNHIFHKGENLQYLLSYDLTDKTFWTAGFYEGLFQFTTDSVFNHYTVQNGLSNNLVRSLLTDNLDRVWLGTQYGLSILKNRDVTVFNKNSGMIDDFIWGITRINGSIYVATNGGLYLIERDHNNQPVLTHPNYFSVFDGKSVNYVDKTSEGIFVTTSEKYGLYEIRNNTFIPLKKILKKEDIRLALYLYEDSKHRIWVGGYDLGFIQNRVFQKILTLPFTSDLKNRNIAYDIVESPVTKNIYFATTSGLYVFDNKSVRLLQASANLNSIFSQVEFDPYSNTLLLGTEGKGIIHYDENSGQFYSSPLNNKIKGENVYNIKYMDSLLLISTETGLTITDPRQGKFWYVNSQNALTENETNSFGLAFDQEYIYLGTSKGVHIIRKDLSQFPPIHEGKLYVKEIIAENKKIPIDSIIFLPTDVKQIKIRLGFTSYFNLEKPVLYYQLAPFQETFHSSASWDIEYYNLPYGKNTLILFAGNSNGDTLSSNVIRFSIHHEEPIYYHSGFYIFLIMLLILLYFIIIKIRTHRLEKLTNQLRKELAEQFKELEYLKELLERVISKSRYGLILADPGKKIIRTNDISAEFIKNLKIASNDPQLTQIVEFLFRQSIDVDSDIPHETTFKDDRNLVWQITFSKIRHGEENYYLLLLSDITTILEKETIEKQIQAYQQIIATLSHYINNTLSALHLKSEIIKSRKNDNDPHLELCDFIDYSVNKVSHILRALDDTVRERKIKISDYVNVKNILIDIETYLAEFEKNNKLK
ncbi:MAG: hypothetical protein Kow00108_00170 [Calditrichia bacterium]